jgi:hypothetical protein
MSSESESPSVILLAIIVFVFLAGMTGIHNIDLAWNFANMPNADISELEDCNLFQCVSIEDMYVKSLTLVEVSFTLNVIVVVVLLARRQPCSKSQ